jgi:hypothetical protein
MSQANVRLVRRFYAALAELPGLRAANPAGDRASI